MVVELKQRTLVAVVLLLLPASWACDSNSTSPTKTELTYGSVSTTNGATFIGGSGMALTCTVDDAFQGANSIPPLSNPVQPFNNPIPLLVSSTQSAAAMAIVAPPSISLNPVFLQSLLPPVQAFLFFRECGRFNTTHAAGPAMLTGTTCWSVRRLQRMNLFGPSDRAAIQRFLEVTFPSSTASMPSGALQWGMVESCL